MTITVFVGDSNDAIAVQARAHSADAYLLDHSNFKKFLKTNFVEDVTIYTAHSDLPKITSDRAVLYEVLNKADVIYYFPPAIWSDQRTDFFSVTNQKSLTLYWLSILHNEKNNVHNIDLSEYKNNQYIALRAVKCSTDITIWNAGCSIARGVGVQQGQQYSNLISQAIDTPVVDLSLGGSSIEYAADQLLRSDIQSGDIVVWGLTEETRFPIWDSSSNRVVAGKRTIETLTETRIYKSLISVHQVVNFCSKIGAKLILLPIICSKNFCLLLSGLEDFYQLPYQIKFVDYGSDNLHPGINQHKMYADFCLNILQENG